MFSTGTAFAAATVLVSTLPAFGELYSFTNVTNNGGAAFAGSHNSMFSLNVTSAGTTSQGRALVDFTFRVDVTSRPSSICDTYFYNGSVSSIAAITSSSGVSFTAGASPGHLPGYSGPYSSLFTADSNSPVAANGVDRNNEWLTVRLQLTSGATFAEMIQQLNSGVMFVGIHVQAQGAGMSNSYGTIPVLVPIPGSLLAGGAGLAALGLFRIARRRAR